MILLAMILSISSAVIDSGYRKRTAHTSPKNDFAVHDFVSYCGSHGQRLQAAIGIRRQQLG